MAGLASTVKVEGNELKPVKPIEAEDSDEDTWACCDKCEGWFVLPRGQSAPKENEQWFCSSLGKECGEKPPKKPKREPKEAPSAAPVVPPAPEAKPTGDGSPPSKRAKKNNGSMQRGGIGAPARAKYGEVRALGLGFARGWATSEARPT